MSADDLNKHPSSQFDPPADKKRKPIPVVRFEPVPTPMKALAQSAESAPVLGETPSTVHKSPSSPWVPPPWPTSITGSESEVPTSGSPPNSKPRSSLDAYASRVNVKPQTETGVSKFSVLLSQKDAEIEKLNRLVQESSLTPEQRQILAEKDQTVAKLHQMLAANRAVRDPPPQDARTSARDQSLARAALDHPETFTPDQIQLLRQALGTTRTEVNTHTPALTARRSPTDAFHHLLAQTNSMHFLADPNSRIEAHAAYNAMQHQDYVKAQVQKALVSANDFYDFMRDRQLLSPDDPDFMANSQLVSYVQAILRLAQDPTEGWKVAKAFLERVFRELSLNKLRLVPVSLQSLLGPYPPNGNHEEALSRCQLFTASLQEKFLRVVTAAPVKESSKLQSLKLQNQKLQSQFKGAKKANKTESADGFPGSPFKTEAFPKYCKFHNGWFNSHGSDDCKFKTNPAIRRRPGDVSGATAPSL